MLVAVLAVLSLVKVSDFGWNGTNDTAAIQMAVSSGAKTVVFDRRKGPWQTDSVRVGSNVELVFEEGVEVVACKGAFRHPWTSLFDVIGASNVTFRGQGRGATLRMRVEDYGRAPYEGGGGHRHGLNLLSVERAVIENLRIVGTGGDGIYFGESYRGGLCLAGVRGEDGPCRDIVIRRCTLDRNYRQGISVISAENLLIEDCVFSKTEGGMPQSGIDFEPNFPRNRLVNCVMRDCLSVNNAGSGYEFYLGNLDRTSRPVSVRIENCRSVGNLNGILFSVRRPDEMPTGEVRFVKCSFADARGPGVRSYSKNGDAVRLTLEDCVIENACTQTGASDVFYRSDSWCECPPDGFLFRNLRVNQMKAHPWFVWDENRCLNPRPVTDFAGDVTVTGPDGRLSQVKLDAAWRARTFAPKTQKPVLRHVPALNPPTDVEVRDLAPGKSVKLTPVVPHWRAFYVFFVDSPGEVRFSWHQQAVLRVPGVGSATVRSDKIAMRVWFDPKKMAAIGISPDEAVSAIRQQNVQASIGSVGATPTGDPNGRVVSLIARGRLNRAEEFEDIIIRSKANGGLVRLRDIARIELGHQAYNYVSFHGDVPAVQILVSLFPGEDLKRTRERLERTLTELARDFPEDLAWEMFYDATRFMYACFRAIVTRAAVGCLVLLAVLFSLLRNVRIVGVVALAILLSILPSFAIVAQTGGSLNVLTLIAAFLAVGITVADVMASLCGASAKSLVWSSLAVVAVFVPICFVNGLTGAIYRQFGLILSSAAFFSVLVALAIVPVLKERWLVADIRLPEFAILSRATFFLSEHRIFLVVLLAFLAIASAAFLKRIPMTLVPDEDTGRINLNVEAPECTRMPLTAEAARQAAEKIGRMKGVSTVLTLCGNSSTGGAGENQALVSVILDDWSARKEPELSVRGIMRRIVEDTSLSPLVAYYPLPPSTVPGLGAAVQLYIMSTSDSDPIRLADEAHRLKRLIARSPLIDRAVCGYTATTPHLRATVDRAKCELMKVPLSTLYATLQNYLGSLYVNDINLGTQVNRVTVEADWGGRAGTEAVKDLFVRSTVGSMVPVGALVSFEEELGPRVCYRYNKYVYCAITIVPADGVSSREAIDETVRILNEELPHGISYAWGSLTFHEMRGGGTPI